MGSCNSCKKQNKWSHRYSTGRRTTGMPLVYSSQALLWASAPEGCSSSGSCFTSINICLVYAPGPLFLVAQERVCTALFMWSMLRTCYLCTGIYILRTFQLSLAECFSISAASWLLASTTEFFVAICLYVCDSHTVSPLGSLQD